MSENKQHWRCHTCGRGSNVHDNEYAKAALGRIVEFNKSAGEPDIPSVAKTAIYVELKAMASISPPWALALARIVYDTMEHGVFPEFQQAYRAIPEHIRAQIEEDAR